MTIDFCGYTDRTTVSAIRQDLASEAKCKEIIAAYKPRRRVAQFDTVFAIINGGNGASKTYRDATGYKGGGFRANLGNGLFGHDNTPVDQIENRIMSFGILPQDTLADVYNKISGSTVLNNDLKNKLLNTLSSSVPAVSPAEVSAEADCSISGMLFNALKNGKKQIVLTGAPGTGKTHSAREYAANYAEDFNDGKSDSEKVFSGFVQFHPSYDYSDFVEGLRPVKSSGGQMIFERIDGAFKSFCRRAAEYNITNGFGAMNTAEGRNEDIINGNYPLFFFIIDKINRADLSKVFGELMFCLESSYRGIPVPTQYMNLKTYDPAGGGYFADAPGGDVFEDGFFIPHNVIVIGTMNDIDKNVEAFDFALRRRFEWLEVKAGKVMEDTLNSMYENDTGADIESKIASLTEKILEMNRTISTDGARYGLTEAYHIGPAYFSGMDLTDDETIARSLQTVFSNNISSILREYLRGRQGSKELIGKCAEKLGVRYEE